MPQSTTTRSFRLPTALLDRVQRYAERMQREVPAGVRVTTTTAVIHLLTYALDALEGPPGRPG